MTLKPLLHTNATMSWLVSDTLLGDFPIPISTTSCFNLCQHKDKMTFHHSKQHEFLDVIMVSMRAIDLLPFHKEHATQHMPLMKTQKTIDPTFDPTLTQKDSLLIHQVQPKYQKSSIISNGPTPTIQPTQQRHFFHSKLSSSASCWLRLQGPTACGKARGPADEADDGRGFHNECLYTGSHDGNSKKTPGNFVSWVHWIFGEVWRYLIYWFPAKNSK